MIKFFRHIRQRLLSDGKTRKYFKYAIGEIILVVIGILIALSINNWNEQRKESVKEQAILKRLENEFGINKEQLLNKIKHRNDIIHNCTRLLEYYKRPNKNSVDSILVYLSSIVPTTFDPIDNDLVSSGNIEILKNEELKKLLINWSTDVIQLQEVEQMFMRFSEQNFLPHVIKKGIQRDIIYTSWQTTLASLLEAKKISNPIPGKSKLVTLTEIDFMSDPILESLIAHSLNLNKFNNEESETLMKRINHILQVLDAEIEK
jgi:hypothetical protein